MPNLDGGTFRSGSHNGPVAEGTFSFGLLLPNTEYEVKIRAKNKYGWSEEEPFFVFKTSRLGKYFHGFFSNSFFFFSFFSQSLKTLFFSNNFLILFWRKMCTVWKHSALQDWLVIEKCARYNTVSPILNTSYPIEIRSEPNISIAPFWENLIFMIFITRIWLKITQKTNLIY